MLVLCLISSAETGLRALIRLALSFKKQILTNMVHAVRGERLWCDLLLVFRINLYALEWIYVQDTCHMDWTFQSVTQFTMSFKSHLAGVCGFGNDWALVWPRRPYRFLWCQIGHVLVGRNQR